MVWNVKNYINKSLFRFIILNDKDTCDCIFEVGKNQENCKKPGI
jgi:hypothetical protein